MAFVIDAFVAMSWCFADEANAHSEAVLDQLKVTEASVPIIWPLEVGNVLLVAERRGRMTPFQSMHFIQVLQSLRISVDSGPFEWKEILTLGRDHRLSAYDASYLELAIRKGLPLATQDTRLRAAAKNIGVPVVGDDY